MNDIKNVDDLANQNKYVKALVGKYTQENEYYSLDPNQAVKLLDELLRQGGYEFERSYWDHYMQKFVFDKRCWATPQVDTKIDR